MLDYETFSEANLKLVGAAEYARHPSTEIVCACWKLGTREELAAGVKTHKWCPRIGLGSPDKLLKAFLDPSITIVAHNAGFEQEITEHVFWRQIKQTARDTAT